MYVGILPITFPEPIANNSTSDSSTSISDAHSDTRPDARKNSRFIVYHYHLLFSQIYNDKSARWPSKHIENIVKKWIQELKISDHKLFEQDFISFKKIAPHTFEIVSRELLATH